MDSATSGAQDTLARQARLASAMLNPALYDHPVDKVEMLETHISYVFLAGAFAYKMKKAVDLGFLDFTTLDARRFYCHEELRLNRRLAPDLYLNVVAIAGTCDAPLIDAGGPPIEYALRMRRFPQDQLLPKLLEHNRLTAQCIDDLATRIADFHATVAVAEPGDGFGAAQAICRPALENFLQLVPMARGLADKALLDTVECWTRLLCVELAAVFDERKKDGFVRECHGDFHLGNIALVDGQVTIFDCIEFNANLRWIDVMNEVAFLTMDLQAAERPDLAHRFVNRYLEMTGDYGGLRVLRFYLAYLAMVRAKVHCMRAYQPDVDAQQKAVAFVECGRYIRHAVRLTGYARPAIIITHGLSGSGKTTLSQSLLEILGAVRVRSDIERKRLAGIDALARGTPVVKDDLYGAEATARTYRRLRELASLVVQAGYPVIVDAAFLRRAQRDAFRRLADELSMPFILLNVVAEEATLRRRVPERARLNNDASDADIAVLERQLATEEPLQADELLVMVTADGSGAAAMGADCIDWNPLFARIAAY